MQWVMKQRKQNIMGPRKETALTGDEKSMQKSRATAGVVNTTKT